jgi:hypothetical protein
MTLTFDSKAINRQIAFFQALPEILHEIALDVAAELEAPILADLAHEAPKRGDEKFIWSLDKAKDQRARRWWFAHLDSIPTDGRHYIRQGTGTNRGFQVDVDREGRVIAINIRSVWPKVRFVYGLLRASNFDTRIPGHKTTGWQLAQPKVFRWTNELQQEIQRKLSERLGK